MIALGGIIAVLLVATVLIALAYLKGFEAGASSAIDSVRAKLPPGFVLKQTGFTVQVGRDPRRP